ncbi:MAG: hypothetical protein AAF617_06340 [Bacteroidota bacterium]
MIQDKNTLKTYFETGDFPTQEQFRDLIDSLAHVEGSTASGTNAIVPNTIFVNTTGGDDTNAAIESSSQPFQTIDAALQALPVWDGADHWTIVLTSAGTYTVSTIIPRRNITFTSEQKVTFEMNLEGNITEEGHHTVPVAHISFYMPLGTYAHTFTSNTTRLFTERTTLNFNCDQILINYTGSENYTTSAYFNLGAGYQSYGGVIKVNSVETNIQFFYGRKFSNDTENTKLEVEINKVTIKPGNDLTFFLEDYRYNLAEANIKIHSFVNESTNYVNLFSANSVTKKNIYLGDINGQGNAVFLFLGISNGFVTFLNSQLTNVYFARSWAAWTPAYRQFSGTILSYTGTNGAVVQTTSHAGSVVYFKNLFIKEFTSNDINAWIFDLWQNNDTRGEWIFENCHFISNCRTLRNGGSTDRIKLIGTNVFNDAGDTTNYSIDKRSPTNGQFQFLNQGILHTKTIRDTLNTDGNPAVVINNDLNTF